MDPVSRRRLLIRGAAIFVAGAAGPALAAPAMAEPPLLTVGGKLGRNRRPDGTVAFDRADLEALGTASFRTRTPWYDDPVTFEGPRMTDLMQAVGAAGTLLEVTALNDYVTRIPISDFARFGALLAMRRDGRDMSTRDKGPLFIVYPYDSDAMLRTELYYSRSPWQVNRMAVL